jgi:hypothetical protein
MMKYIEFGIGNRWLVRTETEFDDGSEIEERGIVRPIKFHSVYLRFWVEKNVIILNTREGWIHMKKDRNKFKLIFGIKSY